MSDVAEDQLPELVRRMAERINALDPGRAAKLWTASYILMGSRYPEEVTENLLGGIQAVKESTTYQKILRDGQTKGLAEGEAIGERRMLLRLGTERFGAPDAVALAVLEAIHDVARLEDLAARILYADVRDWDDWLGLA